MPKNLKKFIKERARSTKQLNIKLSGLDDVIDKMSRIPDQTDDQLTLENGIILVSGMLIGIARKGAKEGSIFDVEVKMLYGQAKILLERIGRHDLIERYL